MKKQPFFYKNHLQGEDIVEEDCFWQVYEPLVKLNLSPLHNDKQEQKIDVHNNEQTLSQCICNMGRIIMKGSTDPKL